MATRNQRSPYKIGLIVVALVTLLYSVFLLGIPLLWVEVATLVFTFYLVWRVVRALERIASATERLDAQLGDVGESWER